MSAAEPGAAAGGAIAGREHGLPQYAEVRTMTQRVLFPTCVIAGLLSVTGVAGAQNAEGEPTLVRGAFTLDSSLGLEVRHDDNIYQSASLVESATITEFTPHLLLALEPSRHRLSLEYTGAFADYGVFSTDDYDNHSLEAAVGLLAGEKNRIELIGGYEDAQENRGSELTQGIDEDTLLLIGEPDRYKNASYLARFTRGLEQGGARLSFELGQDRREYDNNKERTRFFDRDEQFANVTFALPVRSALSFVMQIDSSDVEYDQARPGLASRDSRQTRLLVGAEFAATARTSGSLKIGRLERKFDDPSVRSFSSPSWEVELRWSPRTYSYFDIGTARTTEESTSLAGETTDTETYSFGWTHEWSDRLSSTLAVSLRAEDYVRGDGSLRTQNTEQFRVDLVYRMKTWLGWAFGLESNSRSSDSQRFEFDQDIARIGIEVYF